MKKYGILSLLPVIGILVLGAPPATANAEWLNTANGRIYTQTDAPGYITGLQKIDDYTYFFNEQGIMQTGFQVIDKKRYYFNAAGQLQFGRFVASDGKTYYGSKTTGALVTNKWVSKRYYQADGSMAVNTYINGKYVGADGRYTGVSQNIGWITSGKNKYYYNDQGVMVKGKVTLDGSLYYFDDITGAMKTGWFKVGKKYYYAKSTGVLVTGKWKNGKYLLSSGAAATGWHEINGKSYLFNSSGKKRNGWVKYKKVYYYCANGVVQKNTWISKKKYYTTDSGARAAGWQTIGKYTYYFDPATGVKKTGYVKVDSVKYYLGTNGRLRQGGWVGSGKYYASASGALLTGLQKIDGSLYFFKTGGKKIVNKRKTIEGETYYFKDDGAAALDSWVKIGSDYYYFQSDGTMAKNKWIDNFYVGPDGAKTNQTKKYGWQTENGKKYYFNKKGVMVLGWKTISGNVYYFDSTGAMVTGIQMIGDKKYYFYSDGRKAVSVTIAVGTKEYTLDADGVVTAEKSIKISGNSVGAQIVNFALQYVGNPYVWGGVSLTNGADCSGFVQTVFSNFNIKLLRVADDQMKGPSSSAGGYKMPVIVDISSMLPGDLLFYGTANYATHVAIYMGDGQIVHASNSQPYPLGGIKISNYDYQTPVRVVRYWS